MITKCKYNGISPILPGLAFFHLIVVDKSILTVEF